MPFCSDSELECQSARQRLQRVEIRTCGDGHSNPLRRPRFAYSDRHDVYTPFEWSSIFCQLESRLNPPSRHYTSSPQQCRINRLPLVVYG